ncbi:HET-domain-containing protein [Acephala macrosclerotiorum]|nr:HET-domain-containing protein [Acephala macrosclerotiorum]
MAVAQPYNYATLPQGSDEIRLLQVAKRDGPMGFEYTLVHFSLQAAPAFQAVSYVWGNPDRIAQLSLTDGTELPVTKSIQDSIPFLSQHCSTGYLWIDQLCINQDDMNERIHQVKMMGNIYRKTAHALVWLDEQEALHPGLWEVDRRISARAQELYATGWSLKVASYVSVFYNFIEKDDEHWAALSRLLRRHWFHRAWVVQEVLLAPFASAIFGTELFSIAHLLRLLRIFLRAYQEYREEGLHYRAVEELYEGYVSYRNRYNVVPFYQLLRNFGGIFQATDKRDHVFAFLGLKVEHGIDIEPDYRRETTAVHVTVAKTIIKGTGSLSILHTSSQESPAMREGVGLPSWVPNWRIEPEHAPLYIPQYREVPLRLPDACRRRRHVWTDGDEADCLIVKGKIVDSISGRRAARFESTTLDSRTEDLHRFLDLDGKLEALRLQWPTDTGLPPDHVRLLRAALADGARENDVPIEVAQFPGINICDYEALLRTYRECKGITLGRYELATTVKQAYLRALQALADVAVGHFLFVTDKAKLGLGYYAADGDQVAVLHGCDTPVLLRPKGDGWFEMVEVIYLEDAMHGEAVVWAEEEANEIILV